jgi:anti-sigma B factor antagonist
VVTAAGEIDLSTAQQLSRALTEAGCDHGLLIVDLSAVDYLDSAGVAVLFTESTQSRMQIVVGDNHLVASIRISLA